MAGIGEPRYALTWPRGGNVLGVMVKLKDEVSGGVFPDGRIRKPLTPRDRERLGRLAPHLKKRVLGQSDAADAVAAALARARCGLGDPRRPVASLLFVGPTGVGKTELARALAEAYYGGAGAAARWSHRHRA